MEVKEIILARAIRAVKLSTALGYWPDIIKQIGEQYSFAQLPDVHEILNAQKQGQAKGAEFLLGKTQRPSDRFEIVVDKFIVFNDGLVVDSRTSTEDCDVFLDNLQEWARSHISGIRHVSHSFYLNQLEVKFNLDTYAKVFEEFGERITSLMEGYGTPEARLYQFGSLALMMQPKPLPGLQPASFSIERRLNFPYAENVFFAQAPLRTQDHIVTLNELEEILARI